jgi:hypothetical protein
MSDNNDKSNMEKMQDGLNAAGDSIKGGLDAARGHIHDATKTQEQKEAEKPIGQKINEAGQSTADAVSQKAGEATNKLQEQK